METVSTETGGVDSSALPVSARKPRTRRRQRCWWMCSRAVSAFATRQTLILFLLVSLSLAGRIALLPIAPIPEPAIQDEFSYLLAGETFAAGRLTNPTHPLWRHFETIHEIMRPSYQSKYPPAQGMVLALGQVVFGHPWYGVWLSVGAMVGALYWACAGWLPPRWALLAGVIALLKTGLVTYWSTSYWGGAVAACAGAMVIGAAARLRQRLSFRRALVLAVGLAVLANSRPMEGALLGLGVMGLLVHSMAGSRIIFSVISWRQFWAPLALVLIPTAGWMLYFNYRVTGNGFDTPYGSHYRQYDISTPFFWDTKPHPQAYVENAHVRAVHQREFDSRAEMMAPLIRLKDFYYLCRQFMGLPLSFCILFGFGFVKWWGQRSWPILMACLPMILWLMTYVWISPHYVAPATAAFYIVIVIVLRRWFHDSATVAQWLLAGMLLSMVWLYQDPANHWMWDKRDYSAQRKAVLEKLNLAPGKKVVLVQYVPGYNIDDEWIYNHADIDRSDIVWAHDMGPERNQELIDYYSGRKFWRLVAGAQNRLELAELTNPARH